MKKIFILLILTIGFLNFNKPYIKGSNENLTETELKFVKDNYNWKSEEFIVINFRQPRSSCHFNNYTNWKKTSKWWNEFYSGIKLDNVRNIFVYSDRNKAKKIIDSKNHFADKDNYFLNNFFLKEKACFGILVINNIGEYQKKSGEYSQKNVEELINNLK
jgi:hypothetical protein